MPTRDEVYIKFGLASEAAQLLETELGTLLLMHECVEADLIKRPNSERATEIYKQINRKTLGQLVRAVSKAHESIASLEQLLNDALAARNILAHSFFEKHNLRINSDDGRDVMLADLHELHQMVLNAYKEVMLLLGYDLKGIVDKADVILLPTGHLPIRT